MLNFVAKGNEINVLSQCGGVMLGYIDENNIFFPNNNMMFKVGWLEEISSYMRKHGIIPLGEILAYYEIKDVGL